MRSGMYVVEARDERGQLALDAPQPPFNVASESQLFNHYFSQEPASSATWDAMVAWFKDRGWHIREKCW